MTDGQSGGTRRHADLPKQVRKHVRRLERQLDTARRLERKRVRKLEKARIRRQSVEAALDEIRDEVDRGRATPRPALDPARTTPTQAPKAAAPKAPTPKPAPKAVAPKAAAPKPAPKAAPVARKPASTPRPRPQPPTA